MIFKSLQYNLPIKDEEFDKIYPQFIQDLSDIHWTSVEIAQKAANFLVTTPGIKVLDIGSGVGKFCIVGALSTKGHFSGVEYRKQLVDLSKKIITDNHISNARIIHSNITEIDFSDYDAFYFFNSFYENLDKDRVIDYKVKVSPTRYKRYRDYMYSQLMNAPLGTRVVTYSGTNVEIPSCYKIKMVDYNHMLRFWIKENHPLNFVINNQL